ncbi:hypothetical protein FH609_002390 [Streptomyces sp. 3MP-14]|uniref:Uncharacterized protein n=1 Tax=Streptomyces mimosae TaxID=2586635 RepID=A0A5N6AQ50_9ACTN|nr:MULTISPECIES: hypothetical protein [Streptomyces]KAB8170801.1 hypothetical protein FH607_000080 [Streptomyces mimosae]KAB8179846.1 hypothetical protein FH609_002390 [Streptomyces sp. 3MP-14]
MGQLTLVVTCTDRKVVTPATALRARSLPRGTVRERAAAWRERVDSAPRTHTLSDLYRGDHWTQARRLCDAAAKAGFATADLWVASAGLGLQPVSAWAPAYAATYSPRHADAVTANAEESAQWWALLQQSVGRATLSELGDDAPVLVVLSEPYARAMAAEIHELAAAGGDALVVGGGEEIPGLHRVPADAGLRRVLGGTLTSLNVRMAASWLERCRNGRLTSPATRDSWRLWAARASTPERYDRKPMTDDQVMAFIRTRLAAQPGLSRTRLLREFRGEGQACEQSRFAKLYVRTVREQLVPLGEP